MEIDWTKVDALAGGLTKGELFNEALFALGGEYCYDGMILPAPTAGSFMLLEIIQSPYMKGEEITDNDVDTALFVLLMGKDAVSVVFEDRLFDVPIIDRVKDFIKDIPNYNRIIIKVFLNTYFRYAMHGFDMIPSADETEPKKMIFDTDWLSGYVSVCNKITGYNMDKIVWEMPIITGGFCFSRYGKENGQKGIERTKDEKAIFEEIKRQMELKAKEEIENGE